MGGTPSFGIEPCEWMKGWRSVVELDAMLVFFVHIVETDIYMGKHRQTRDVRARET